MTSNIQFSGMEASCCVFITKRLIEETGARSGLLRATTRLVVVSYTEGIDITEIKNRFLVYDTKTIKDAWRGKNGKMKGKKQKQREEARMRKESEPVAMEVDAAAIRGDIFRVKHLQQSDTIGILGVPKK